MSHAVAVSAYCDTLGSLLQSLRLSMTNKNQKQLRTQIRDARRQIPVNYARQASYKFSERIAQLPAYQKANSIAGYLAFDGEADPTPLMDRAILERKSVFVPVMVGAEKPLLFAEWTRQAQLKKNSFGIFEPDVPRISLVDADKIDCVVTPLVAFDEDCNRLGVGGGYYDRSFAFLKNSDHPETTLIGMAYEMQKLEKLKSESWDVPLTAVVTEFAVYGATA